MGDFARQEDDEGCHVVSSGVVTRPALWLRRLMINRFRSYETLAADIDARPLVITGANGAGKTNLLEAVSLLGPGRGLRAARLGDLEQRAAVASADVSGWAVAAEVETADGPVSLGTGTQGLAGEGRERRQVKIDGRPVRGQSALGEVLRLVWLTPQMDGLFRDPANERRRFIDRLVAAFDPAHSGRLHAYEHALRERSRLLKSGEGDGAWYTSLEDTMARYGVAIAAARRDLVGRLNGAARVMAAFPTAVVDLDCEVDRLLSGGPALLAEDAVRTRLVGTRQRDTETGRTAVGPHRADLLVTHRGKNMPAALCSTGEQKALLIALLLTHARLLSDACGLAPVLLLDEVVAHLDVERRRALFAEILELGAQAWMTGTDGEAFRPLGEAAQFFYLREQRLWPGSAERL